MKRFPLAAVLLSLIAAVTWLEAQDKAPSPAQSQPGQAAAVEELKKLSSEFNKTAYAHNQATDAAERTTLAAQASELCSRTLEFAGRNAKTPLALDALTQVVTQEYWLDKYTAQPGQSKDNRQARAIAQLLRDHLESDQLGETCKRVHYGFRRECETFLRTVLEKNPHRNVRGAACLRLAQFLASRRERLDLLAGQPELTQRHETLYGKGYLESLRRQDAAQVMKESESLYEQAAEKYGDVPLPYDMTVGRQVETDLFDLRHLTVGREALEIEGTDQDGVKFKLSDYRGKVVLLYFWLEY
jgi:hypothetical protein